MASPDLLTAETALDWDVAKPPAGYTPRRIYVGKGGAVAGLEVAVVDCTGIPTREALSKLHKERHGGRAYALVVLGLSGSQAWLFGPNPQSPVVGPLDRGQALRLAQSALQEPDGTSAAQRFAQVRVAPEAGRNLGYTNAGLFASHHLRSNVPMRSDWSTACGRSKPMLSKTGLDLITALGFTTKRSASDALLLTAGSPTARAVAVLLDEGQQFDSKDSRYQVSPVAFGLKVAAQQEVPWLMLLRGSQIRLYPARDGVGVGQRGQADTFFELDLSLIADEDSGLLDLIFSAHALEPGGTTSQILSDSAKYASELGTRLKNRIYEHVVPELAKAVAGQLPKLKIAVDNEGLSLAYRLTLRILFRLLFTAYAEDRGLLPYERNDKYTRNALKTLVVDDLIPNEDNVFDEASHTLWDDLAQVWGAINEGESTWNVPAYNGGLFADDEELHFEGWLISNMRLTNNHVGPALKHMFVDLSEDGVNGPVDFRSLSVREFGTIYEGLLESSLSLAEQDLTVDSKGAWVPAGKGDEVLADKGSVYFHSASGERKATGSYFTPSFIVDHLLDQALDPALEAHFERVTESLVAGRETEAYERFFDFRVADLAMGSGHFLVSAVDRIESAMRNYLVDHPIPGVALELARLEAAAKEALGKDWEFTGDVDRAGLLRRQVARRCIYGLDINPLAVELSRLALWIHTFVPGLPMSSLDHGLVCANSLTGIGTVEEALDALDPSRKSGQASLFGEPIYEALDVARRLLGDAASADEATKKEVKAAAKIAAQARAAAEPTRLIFDAAVAARLGIVNPARFVDAESVLSAGSSEEVQEKVSSIQPAHMPYLFPEVFLREQPGFDVVLGNPPWEKMHVEEHQWWGLRIPGLRGMAASDRVRALKDFRSSRPDLEELYEADVAANAASRAVVAAGPYPGLGSGHIDLYQAFAWRNWTMCRDGGAVGVLLPRGAVSGSGLKQWRGNILSSGTFAQVLLLTNTSGWIFPSVHGQYTVAAIGLRRGARGPVRFSGPINSSVALSGIESESFTQVDPTEFASWSDTVAFPALSDAKAGQVFQQLRKASRFDSIRDSWTFRPLQGDLNAATDKSILSFDTDDARGRVPVYGGASFNLWEPDAGAPYAYTTQSLLDTHQLAKLSGSSANRRSVFYGDSFEDPADLPYKKPRIAFRDVTNQTNSRTVIACLLPPGTAATHKAPLIVRRAGSARDEAYLLGVMCSIPFDWYARRWVELSLTFELLNTFPVPQPQHGTDVTDRIVTISGSLAVVDERFREWASQVGVPIGSVATDHDRSALVAELDALVALAYGLSREHVTHIFENFHRGWDYKPRLDAVNAHFDRWETKK